MKVFESKNLFKKLVIALLCILIFSLLFSGNVKAESSIGGKLLKPVIDLVLSLGDGLYDIIHKVILQQNMTLLHVDLTGDGVFEFILTAAVFIIVSVAAVAAIVATGGAIAALLPALSSMVSIGVGTTLVVATATGALAASVFNAKLFPDDELLLPLYSISPEEIFSNELVIFDVDFFNPESEKVLKDENGETLYDENGDEIVLESTSRKLKQTISNWYIILRDISLVALLSVLVYIGIRILISSTSGDKAKYKQMLLDWIVAICLLFTMQYIMSFSNLAVEKITDVLTGISYDNKSVQIVPDKDGKVTDALKNDYKYTDDQIEKLYVKDGDNYVQDSDGNKEIYWHTNLIGIARLNAQMGAKESAAYAGYTVIFIILVFFTLFFMATYLKRVIYMAFLTLIAPLVAMTYPIDKINDGKAQAFNMWFKEYIFNLLIQPMHLILYTILVTSAFELASKNIVYSLVALGFMVPAEKLMRKFFGFEKAQTPGLLAGPAGAMATMGIMNKLFSRGSKGHSAKGGTIGEGKGEDNRGIKFKDDLPEQGVPKLDDGNSNIQEQENPGKIGSGQKGDIGNNPELNTESNSAVNTGAKSAVNLGNNYNIDGIDGGLDNGIRSKSDESLVNILKSEDKGKAKKILKLAGHGAMSGLKAGGKATRYYARGMKYNAMKKMKDKIKNAHPARAVIRTAGGLAAGTAAASIGLAAGVVSGDPTKAVQYTAAAAAGGFKIGSGVADKATNALSVDGTKNTFDKELLGSEQYKQTQIQKNIKEAQNDFDMQNELESEFGTKKAKEIRKTVLPECVRYGINTPKDVVAVAKLEEQGVGKYDAMQAAISVNEYGKNTSKLGAKDSDDLNKTLVNRAKKNKRLKNEEEVNKTAARTRELMDRYSNIKFKK